MTVDVCHPDDTPVQHGPERQLARAHAKNEAAICLRDAGFVAEAQRLAYDALKLTLMLVEQPASAGQESRLRNRIAVRLGRVQDEMYVYDQSEMARSSGVYHVADGPLRRCLDVIDTVLVQLDRAHRSAALRRRLQARARYGVTVLVLGFMAALIWHAGAQPSGKYQAEYFSNPELEGVGDLVVEDEIAHSWGDGAPLSSIPFGPFSARWISCVFFDDTQTLNLEMRCNGGCRAFVDGQPVLDRWQDGGEAAAAVELTAGAHRLLVEYADREDIAELHFSAISSTHPTRGLEWWSPTIDGECLR